MTEMVDIAALNSRIKFDKTDVPFDQREILGDATETGLARFAGRQLRDYDAHIKNFPKVFEGACFGCGNLLLLTYKLSAFQFVK
jgi:sodium/potassium-transporting ATPase subunit alpha